MSAQVIVQGTLKPDGTLDLDQKPTLSPGRVRVTVETVTESTQPQRFWAMMEQIWTDLKANGHVPRSVEEIEAERQAFRNEWDEHQEALEQIHRECDQSRQAGGQPEEQSR